MKKLIGRNRRRAPGFSALEMLIAISIGAVVLLGTASLFKRISDSREGAMNEMNRLSSESVGGLQVYMDLLAADVFNVLESRICEAKDGNLEAVRLLEADEFFLHNPAAPGCDLANPAPACTRKKELKLGTPGEIILTTVRKMAGPGPDDRVLPGTVTLRPTILFNDAPTTDIFRTSGKLTFTPNAQLIATLENFGMGDPGSLIRLISPFETRALSSTGNGYEYGLAPRNPSITILVNSDGKIVPAQVPGTNCQPRWGFETAAGANELVDSNKPGIGTAGNELETFFRLLTPDAGANTWVKASMINVISYRLEEVIVSGRKTGRLVRHTWNPLTGDFDEGRVLIEGIKAFTLTRPNIRTPSIFYAVERQTR